MNRNHKILPNNEVIGSAIALLQSGQRVVLPVKGYSMLPFIIGGQESVELCVPEEPLRVGDVVLAWINGSHYVVHRIIGIEGDRVELFGDGNLRGGEFCALHEVAARADYIIDRHGQRRYLYTPHRLRLMRLWWRLQPVRRWLLAIYRRTILKLKTSK